jgi:hypothetical protein
VKSLVTCKSWIWLTTYATYCRLDQNGLIAEIVRNVKETGDHGAHHIEKGRTRSLALMIMKLMFTDYIVWLCIRTTLPRAVLEVFFFIWNKKLFCMPCNQNPIKSLFQLSPLVSNDYGEHPYLLYSCLLPPPPSNFNFLISLWFVAWVSCNIWQCSHV